MENNQKKYHKNIVIQMPENVRLIIDTLSKNGYEAYAVGGCIRDSVLGREPQDWDITTSALPAQVKELFRRTVDTGIAHGTVTIMLGKTGYEVTTFRIDGDYEDARHPKSVEFTSNLVLDLKRRDFTINAMAYNEKDGLVDAFEGIDDLNKGIIRCVGSPSERFSEDALRILRAIRFSAQLGFDIEEETAEAITRLAPALEKISKERIHTEFNKILKSAHPEYFEKAKDFGITKVLLPQYDAIEAGRRSFISGFINHVDNQLPERYAALLFPCGKEQVTQILRSLKMDNHTILAAGKLVENIPLRAVENERQIRHLIYQVGEEYILRVMKFSMAYEQAADDGQYEKLAAGYQLCRTILERGDCTSIKQLAITGKDLIDAGVPQGKPVGNMLEALLELVLEEPEKNCREILLQEAAARKQAEGI